MKYWLCLLLCLAAAPLAAQKILRGVVKNQETGQPVAGASVYLSNTTTGAATGDDGGFVIAPFPEGRYDLVVSAVGYEVLSTKVNGAELPARLVLMLVPKAKEMEEVVVMPFLKDGWKDWGELFMDNLIGQTPYTGNCKLVNREAVRFRFNKKENYVEAVAREPLLIENRALGYSLSYDLVEFRVWLEQGYCLYLGYPLFKDLETDSKKQQQRWLRNREDAYRGSVMHFMRSLYRNTLVQDSFEVRRVLRPKKADDDGTAKALPPVLLPALLPGDSIARVSDNATVKLLFNGYLQVLYRGKNNPRAYIRYQDITIPQPESVPLAGRGTPVHRLLVTQPVISEIYTAVPAEGVEVLYNGHYHPSTNLVSLQFWAWSEKLSNLLPLDYGNPQPVNAREGYKK